MGYGTGGGEGKASFNDFTIGDKPKNPKSSVPYCAAFVDKYGRIKVQFHWSRNRPDDESHSSCMWCPQ
jgi:hypothetical protein